MTTTTPPLADPQIRRASLIAGLGLLLMIPLAALGNFVAVEGLVSPGDAARTAADIRASEALFRLGVVSLLLVIPLDVAVAWALWRVLRPVSPEWSRLAAWLRVVYSGVFLVAVARLAGVPRLLGDGEHGAAFGADQVHALALLEVEAFRDTWGAGLALFGVHLLVVGALAYRSGYVPWWLGVLVVIAGLGYVLDSLAEILAPGVLPKVALFTFPGEVLLALWLVIRGRRLTVGEPTTRSNESAAAR